MKRKRRGSRSQHVAALIDAAIMNLLRFDRHVSGVFGPLWTVDLAPCSMTEFPEAAVQAVPQQSFDFQGNKELA